jgi:hypothetical protein
MVFGEAIRLCSPEGCNWVIEGEDVYENITWLSPDKPMPTKDEILQKVAELEAALPMQALRKKRDRLLLESDKYIISDWPITPENLEKMKTYRQELRNLPSFNNPDITFPEFPL